jgi:hypothetical protein
MDMEIGVKKAYVPHELRGTVEDTVPVETHKLDTPEYKLREKQLREWWSEARTASADNRQEQSIDADFFDGLQWQDDDAEVLRERGQAPLVFNQIAQHIRWILGTERRTRVDFKVHGRGKEDTDPALNKTKLLKYTDDANHSPMSRSLGFADAVKVGVGWLECGIRNDPTKEPLFDRMETWRNIWNDPMAREPDNSDSRFLFRSKWVDEDVGITMFPDRAALIKLASVSHDLFADTEEDDIGFSGLYHGGHSNQAAYQSAYQSGSHQLNSDANLGIRRKRVRLIEVWYRQPEKVELIRSRISPLMNQELRDEMTAMNGQEVSGPLTQQQERLVENGYASVYNAVRMKVRVAIFCTKGLLQDEKSPYKHEKFPFTPIWGFKRDRDNQPYGVIRNMRDPQEDLNKRRSKALHILSTKQVIADEDAVEDWDELEEQVARPDGIIKKMRGTELEINSDTTLAREHVNLMIQDQQFLENSSGVTEENRGEVTNAISGSAISLRQTQGSVVTADLFDNLRFAIQLHGEKKLALVEQYYTEPKQFRLTNERGQAQFDDVNMPQDDGSVLNDITKFQSDFVVDTQDFRETVRLAMFESMMNLMGQLDPEVQLNLLDLVIGMSDIPQKEEMSRRIRDMNGQVDPESPTADEDRKAAAAQRSEDADRDTRATEAEIRVNDSKSAKTFSDAGKSESETMAKSAEIADMIAANPTMAAAMDELFASFKEGGGEVDPNTSGAVAPTDAPPPEEQLPPPEQAPI